ncbi:MAG: NAD-dependent epimerase/dehydratase family protein [Planctomycetota bacterium]
MPKILVTGGAGFIGSHVAERLLRRGDDVWVLDNFNDFYDPAIKRDNLRHLPGVRLVEADLRDEAAVAGLYADVRFDGVVHLAAMAGVRPSLVDPLLYIDVNVRGTQILLQRFEDRPDAHFVFASSSSVYGGNGRAPFRESDDIHRPVSPYAATKRAGELMCYTHHHLYGTPVTCLRYFTVYGPRQRPEMAIHTFIRRILAGEPIPFFGDGTTRRDYTYIDDIVDGTIRALDRPAGYRIFNLGESETISLAELVAVIGEVTGVAPVLDRRPLPPGDMLVTHADVSKAAAEIGYRPRTTIRTGLARFLAWYREVNALATHEH